MDQDGAAVTAQLKAALASSGLSQAQFARALGTSPSRFSTYLTGRTMPSASWFLRALRVGEGVRLAREQAWLAPLTAAPTIRSALTEGDSMWALRLILECRDHLNAVMDRRDAAQVSAAWEAAPPSTGAGEWDRLLAAVIAHEFDDQELIPPVWTAQPAAPERLVFSSPFFSAAEVEAATPQWLAERGVFIASRDLVTA